MKILTLGDKTLFKVFVVMGVALAFIIAGMFFVGGIVTCGAGGGSLSGFRCVDPDVVGVCVFDDKLYEIPSGGELNWSIQ